MYNFLIFHYNIYKYRKANCLPLEAFTNKNKIGVNCKSCIYFLTCKIKNIDNKNCIFWTMSSSVYYKNKPKKQDNLINFIELCINENCIDKLDSLLFYMFHETKFLT